MDTLTRLLMDYDYVEDLKVFRKGNEIVLYDSKTNTIYIKYEVGEKEE